MNVAICDDELPDLESLRRLVDDYGRRKQLPVCISAFQSGEELVACIASGRRFDLIFLDVLLGPSSGILVARRIREFDEACFIVFATNSREYAIDGYGVRALQYLLKPIGAEALAEALDQAAEARKAMIPKAIHVKTRQCSYTIPLEQIIFAESDARVITIHRRSQEAIRFYDRLDNLELDCKDERFLRCHKSFLVNLDYVRSIVRNSIVMETGQIVPVSISISRAKEIFASYTAGKI